MHNFKFYLLAVLLALSFSLNSCQGNNSDGIVSNTPPVYENNGTINTDAVLVLPINTTTLTTNSQTIRIDVKVFDVTNNPYSGGVVKIINPNDVLTGRDVGVFENSSVELLDGVATFDYTGPTDISQNTSNIVFSFYHDSNISNAKTFTILLAPDVNQTILTTYDLQSNIEDGESMELQGSKSASFTIYDADGVQLSDENIKSMTITSQNPDIALLSDSFGNSGEELTQEKSNAITVNINANMNKDANKDILKSGIVPISVQVVFIDANGEEQQISKVFPLLVLSGPPTAMSLQYGGTSQGSNGTTFIEKWVLSVTDRYNNKVNTKPSVSTGLITGFAQSSGEQSNAGNYLFFPPGAKGGSISSNSGTFTAPDDVFSHIDDANDILVVYGENYTYDASGKWDIVSSSANRVNLIDEYKSENRSNLGFAVGHNKRDERCEPGVSAIANVYPETNSSVIGEDGTLSLSVEYDYYLTGKDTMLWVNLIGKQNSTGEKIRLGTARKITLRANGLETESYAYAAGFSGKIRFFITITDTVEYYKNANFGYKIEVTGKGTSWRIDKTSMNDGIMNCSVSSGVAYIDVEITASDPEGSGGIITISDVLTSPEI